MGVIDRENKKIFAKVALPSAKGEKLTGKQLFNILRQACSIDNRNIVITDELSSYNILDNKKVVHLRVIIRRCSRKGLFIRTT